MRLRVRVRDQELVSDSTSLEPERDLPAADGANFARTGHNVKCQDHRKPAARRGAANFARTGCNVKCQDTPQFLSHRAQCETPRTWPPGQLPTHKGRTHTHARTRAPRITYQERGSPPLPSPTTTTSSRHGCNIPPSSRPACVDRAPSPPPRPSPLR